MISWTLEPPPVPAEKPKRKLDGSGPLLSVIFTPAATVCVAPPLALYEKSSRPSEVIFREKTMGIALARSAGSVACWLASAMPAGTFTDFSSG